MVDHCCYLKDLTFNLNFFHPFLVALEMGPFSWDSNLTSLVLMVVFLIILTTMFSFRKLGCFWISFDNTV